MSRVIARHVVMCRGLMYVWHGSDAGLDQDFPVESHAKSQGRPHLADGQRLGEKISDAQPGKRGAVKAQAVERTSLIDALPARRRPTAVPWKAGGYKSTLGAVWYALGPAAGRRDTRTCAVCKPSKKDKRELPENLYKEKMEAAKVLPTEPRVDVAQLLEEKPEGRHGM